MLELKNIVKEYKTGESVVSALAGVSLGFRENEFVSILGPSGCGKTTLLNIVGGLDRYTHGDLIINGKSTKDFKDGDWDAYRNHSIGFVFQSYNLIPHQTVLSNVELALTLSGVSKSERRAKAIEALKKVGLGDQLHKKPNQMSGGQMQRVAIARALVNNPDILLADEPTGALDTHTSVQIMDLLKEVANDRLVIMVTHNPDLAEQYSTRIVKLSDGIVVDDSNPITDEEYEILHAKDVEYRKRLAADKKAARAAEKKKSMSFGTAISLSLKNLLTKKGRTILTSFAGSIGIIGIALILALSNGIQLFIDQVQEDSLSTFPLTIQKETQDMSAMLSAMTSSSQAIENPDPNTIYVDSTTDTLASALTSTVTNDLEAFKAYIEEHNDEIQKYVSDIQYTYAFDLQVYNTVDHGVTKLGLSSMLNMMGDQFAGMSSMLDSTGMGGMDVMSEMINNQDLLDQQYEVVKGHWPEKPNEIVLVIGKNNQISKMTLYMLGVLDQDELEDLMGDLMSGNYKPSEEDLNMTYSMDDFIGKKFMMLNSCDFYAESSREYPDGSGKKIYEDLRNSVLLDEAKLLEHINANGIELEIAGIIRPQVDAASTSIAGAIGYTKELTDLMLEKTAESPVIKEQIADPTINVLTGTPFVIKDYESYTQNELIDELITVINSMDTASQATILSYMTPIAQQMLAQAAANAGGSLIDSPQTFGVLSTLIPEAERKAIIAEMLDKAAEANPMALQGVYAMISTDLLKIDSKEDVLTALDLLSLQTSPEAVPPIYMLYGALLGEKALLGQETSQIYYNKLNGSLEHLELTKDNFSIILSVMKTKDDATEDTDPESDAAKFKEMLIGFLEQIQTEDTYDSTLKLLGSATAATPASINFYAKDFNSKDEIKAFIARYNESVDESKQLEYTDLVGALMSSVSIIINVISYILIAFVSISLVVSSIMIGIITNISVLERTKEIGILRAIGASKKDISRVFNAETFIVGLIAGIFGIVITLLLCWPTNAIIQGLSGFSNIKAVLPAVAAVILVCISMLLTILAGLIPSKSASKKDPVVALRTE